MLIDVKRLNLIGLKVEVTRSNLRVYKKCIKITEKFQKAMKEYEDIIAMDNPPMEVLESCPNVDEIKQEMETLKSRLSQLSILEDSLKLIKSTSDPKFEVLGRAALGKKSCML